MTHYFCPRLQSFPPPCLCRGKGRSSTPTEVRDRRDGSKRVSKTKREGGTRIARPITCATARLSRGFPIPRRLSVNLGIPSPRLELLFIHLPVHTPSSLLPPPPGPRTPVQILQVLAPSLLGAQPGDREIQTTSSPSPLDFSSKPRGGRCDKNRDMDNRGPALCSTSHPRFERSVPVCLDSGDAITSTVPCYTSTAASITVTECTPRPSSTCRAPGLAALTPGSGPVLSSSPCTGDLLPRAVAVEQLPRTI